MRKTSIPNTFPVCWLFHKHTFTWKWVGEGVFGYCGNHTKVAEEFNCTVLRQKGKECEKTWIEKVKYRYSKGLALLPQQSCRNRESIATECRQEWSKSTNKSSNLQSWCRRKKAGLWGKLFISRPTAWWCNKRAEQPLEMKTLERGRMLQLLPLNIL